MPRRRRRRANWPYRFAWIAIVGSLLLFVSVGTLIGGLTYGYRSYGIDWWIAFVTTAMSATIATWFFAVGASLGSFLNVVAYRLPLGRSVGGHSGCPYCCTPIQRFDNVPVLAWIKLRGRCRTCRLPISPQYPLVEFLVGMIFLTVFLSEVARGGANLPIRFASFPLPIYQVPIDSTLILRLLSYCAVLCGLVACGLITVKGSRAPLKLFAWSLLPMFLSALIEPRIIIVFWRQLPAMGPIESRLQATATIAIGLLAGATVAWLISFILIPRTQSRLSWIAGSAIIGAIVGWQSVVPCIAVVIASWLVCRLLFRRFSDRLLVDDPVVWMWLGLLVFRGSWRQFFYFQPLPESIPELARHAVGVVGLLAGCWLISSLISPKPSLNEPPLDSPRPYTENDSEALT